MSVQFIEALTECYRLAGGDMEYLPRNPFELATRAVEIVRDLRECYDEALQFVPLYDLTVAGRAHLEGKK